jgi:hypothetical protein
VIDAVTFHHTACDISRRKGDACTCEPDIELTIRAPFAHAGRYLVHPDGSIEALRQLQ